MIPREGENAPDGITTKKDTKNTHSVILTRKCAAVVTRGGKKAQEEDHEFDVEGKSVVSGKKRTGWM